MKIYTKEQIQEIVRCTEDPEYFINTYCYLEHLMHGNMKMSLSPKQKNWIGVAQHSKIVELGNERQDGKTQFIAAYALWSSIFELNKTSMIFSHKFSFTETIRDRIRYMLNHLPEFLRPQVQYDNRDMTKLDTGCKIYYKAITVSSCRGMTVDNIFLDTWEYVKPNLLYEFKCSIIPCMDVTASKIIMTGSYDQWLRSASS